MITIETDIKPVGVIGNQTEFDLAVAIELRQWGTATLLAQRLEELIG